MDSSEERHDDYGEVTLAEREAERLYDLAAFVVAFHWTPADYWEMTLAEREAILREHRRVNKPK